MFATTKALAFQRSAELCEANQKRQFLKTEGFSSRNTVYCNTIGQEPPPNFFLGKKFSSPVKRDSFFKFLILKKLAKHKKLKDVSKD